MELVAVVQVSLEPEWFRLDLPERKKWQRDLLQAITASEEVSCSWFDAEAWTGKFTDFSLCEFEDLDSYNSLWGDLRRHPFLSTPFAFASRVVMGMELAAESFPEPPPLTPAPLVCTNCGHHLKAIAKFCGGCGSVNAYHQGVPGP
ncbi:hypothetical protein IV102_21035 [bacterium]|nr:hypothetical protein [bacterium]